MRNGGNFREIQYCEQMHEGVNMYGLGKTKVSNLIHLEHKVGAGVGNDWGKQ